MKSLFEEFILKAIVMSENFLQADFSENKTIDDFTNNRDRLFSVIDQISRQIDWNLVSEENKNELYRQIDYLKKTDEMILIKLQEHKQKIKEEIEATVRKKENIKSYNLSDVK